MSNPVTSYRGGSSSKVRRPAFLTVIILVFIGFLQANTEINFPVGHKGSFRIL